MTYGSAPSLLCNKTLPAEPRDWRRTPAQLREGVHAFLALTRSHPQVSPAVLAAVMASPVDQRRRLLDEVIRQCLGERDASLDGSVTRSPAQSSACSSSDEVWEDAVEDPDAEHEVGSGDATLTPTMAMASVVTDAAAEVARLEREAADCHRRWQTSRQLAFWTRYNECRARIAALSGRRPPHAQHYQADDDREERERAMRANRWSQLQAQRELHERRLAELSQRRERLRWSRHYDERTRALHSTLARRQLEDELRRLDERAQVRRLEHMRRVQQLTLELSADEEREEARERRMAAAREARAGQSSTPALPTATVKVEAEDEFTHVWDDFSHWEKMVNDEETSPRKGALALSLPNLQSQSDVGAPVPERAASVPNVPSVPSLPGQAAMWRTDQARTGKISFEERKKWFEEALLAWHAQDDEEDFGTSLYAREGQGVIGQPKRSSSNSEPSGLCAPNPAWFHSAWGGWQGPAVIFN